MEFIVQMTFKETLDAIPGLVPLEVDLREKTIIWGDIGRFRLRQALYDWGLRECHDSVGIRSILRAPLNVLEEDSLISDALTPSGFIFHMSRCGSSVVAKALSHGENNLMISEPEPLNQVLFFLSENLTKQATSSEKKRMLVNMILTFGRKRQLRNVHYYLKFTSWNIFLAETIRSVFPLVPSVFLYRNPEEVMVSISRNATGFSQARQLPIGESLSGCGRAALNEMSQEHYIAAVLARMITSAIDQKEMHFLNYKYISAESLPHLLEYLNARPSSTSLQAMKSQFRYDSKDPHGIAGFDRDAASKQAAVTPAIGEACESWLAEPYRLIKQSNRNIIG